MPRVKRGVTSRARHKTLLKKTKGHVGARSKIFRRAHESLIHAMDYATRDRHARKQEFRRLWIVRINAAAHQYGLNYSKFMAGLERAGITLDRKVLADLAVNDEKAFGKLAERAKAA